MNSEPKIRSENGKRREAEVLHSTFNKSLHCPTCQHQDGIRGTFTKDSGGSAGNDGLRYRRFVCHRRHGCGATLGVTDFIQLCQRESLTIPGTGIIDFLFIHTCLLFHSIGFS